MVEPQPSSSLPPQSISIDEKLTTGSESPILEKLHDYLKDIDLLGVTRPEEAEKAKVKREVRREDASTSPLDTGASTSSNSKIRVLNHKDYKTWKVRIGSINSQRRITGFFEPWFVFSEDTVKSKYFFAYGKTTHD